MTLGASLFGQKNGEKWWLKGTVGPNLGKLVKQIPEQVLNGCTLPIKLIQVALQNVKHTRRFSSSSMFGLLNDNISI